MCATEVVHEIGCGGSRCAVVKMLDGGRCFISTRGHTSTEQERSAVFRGATARRTVTSF